MKETVNSPSRIRMYDVDVETDGNNRKTHYRGNNKKAGYIVYTVSIVTYIHIAMCMHIASYIASIHKLINIYIYVITYVV